ncbi:DMT family transporter [Shewanella waksmanii]|uniref:DMT family transporter n=1 Tax=Shewanella waksmanii TaxID=213783 RepID=UPI00049178D8|nr:DMT family transporter [Shewanella waksmanii]
MRGIIYLLIATLLAAMGWVASKFVVSHMPGDLFLGVRFVLASLILLPFCYQRLAKLDLKQILTVLGVGVFLGLALQVWVHAVTISDSLSEGAFIMSLAMIIAPLVSWSLFQIKPNRSFWLALPVSMMGMALLTLGSGWHLESSQLYFLMASALLSIHFVLNKNIGSRLPPLLSICLQLFAVGVVGLITASLSEPAVVDYSWNLLWWFVISTVFATSVRYLLQTMGQYKVKLETAALIMILEPVWTMLLSITLLQEQLAWQKLVGAGLIMLSLIAYIKLSRREAKLKQLQQASTGN